MLTGLLFLQRISDNRMTGTSQKNTRLFEMVCGTGALQNVILVTTMWNAVDETTGSAREKDLQTHFWDSMITSGSRVARFDYTYQSAWSILNQFTGDLRPLLLQKEMVEDKKPLAQTSVGIALFQILDQLVKQFRDTIFALRQRLRIVTKRSEIGKEIQPEILTTKRNIAGVKEQKNLIHSVDNTSQARRLGAADEKHFGFPVEKTPNRASPGGADEAKVFGAGVAAGMVVPEQPTVEQAWQLTRREEKTTNLTMKENHLGLFANPNESHVMDLVALVDSARKSFEIIELWQMRKKYFQLA
jgi:hypothetical protein